MDECFWYTDSHNGEGFAKITHCSREIVDENGNVTVLEAWNELYTLDSEGHAEHKRIDYGEGMAIKGLTGWCPYKTGTLKDRECHFDDYCSKCPHNKEVKNESVH